ncbi:MAG: hypothetical protein ACP5N9_01200 [Candidatus Bilamarchaeum sp.]|jgi:predicted transcriptional regulator
MKTILFYWGKGAETRVKIIQIIGRGERESEPVYSNLIADELGISKVAIKKHVDLLIEEKYIKLLNPDGKPHYLVLTEQGIEVLKEFSKR